MAAEVKVLLEGFTTLDSNSNAGNEKTQPTVSLVLDGDIIMVVDPGTLETRQILVEKIMQEGFETEDINYVCITHSHIDHYKNIGMFPDAKILEYFGIWDKNTVEDYKNDFTEDIRILKTPGHDNTSITLLVNTEQGKVAICGDVFWREDKPEIDPYALDLKKLEESRKLVLDAADFIIPGHGPMYKVDRNLNNAKNNAKSILPVINPISILSTIKRKLVSQELGVCRKCRRPFKKTEDKCACQLHLCYFCCECDMDCELCSCKHKRYRNDKR